MHIVSVTCPARMFIAKSECGTEFFCSNPSRKTPTSANPVLLFFLFVCLFVFFTVILNATSFPLMTYSMLRNYAFFQIREHGASEKNKYVY